MPILREKNNVCDLLSVLNTENRNKLIVLIKLGPAGRHGSTAVTFIMSLIVNLRIGPFLCSSVEQKEVNLGLSDMRMGHYTLLMATYLKLKAIYTLIYTKSRKI